MEVFLRQSYYFKIMIVVIINYFRFRQMRKIRLTPVNRKCKLDMDAPKHPCQKILLLYPLPYSYYYFKYMSSIFSTVDIAKEQDMTTIEISNLRNANKLSKCQIIWWQKVHHNEIR